MKNTSSRLGNIKEEEIRPKQKIKYVREVLYYKDLRSFKEKYSQDFVIKKQCIACKSPQISPSKKKDGFSFYKCKDCLTVFINPRPTEQQLEWWYNTPFCKAATKLLYETYNKRKYIYI